MVTAPDVCPVSPTPWLRSNLPSEFDVDLATQRSKLRCDPPDLLLSFTAWDRLIY